ncbi:MAG: translation elongation factor Ts [Gemmatimonadetes bacterium]|nr:translation elongation factor Ts [Gemmatimonadota bacterium]
MTATAFTAKDVAELRARTGAGMMDCKKALDEARGNMDSAIELLRKKGMARADKRTDRQASEGQIALIVAPDGQSGTLVEVNSETDFVGRNDEFVAFSRAVAEHVAQDDNVNGVVHVGAGGELLDARWHTDGSRTVGEVVKGMSARTGENVVLRRVARFTTDGVIGTYLHHNGKVAVLVELGGATGAAAIATARSVAEHIAAGVPAVPVAVSRDQVPPELIDRERRIFEEQARASGKPDNIIARMVDGRIAKFYGEVVLMEQPWVRDDSRTIGQLLKDAGAGAAVRRFARFQMGEA